MTIVCMGYCSIQICKEAAVECCNGMCSFDYLFPFLLFCFAFEISLYFDSFFSVEKL